MAARTDKSFQTPRTDSRWCCQRPTDCGAEKGMNRFVEVVESNRRPNQAFFGLGVQASFAIRLLRAKATLAGRNFVNGVRRIFDELQIVVDGAKSVGRWRQDRRPRVPCVIAASRAALPGTSTEGDQYYRTCRIGQVLRTRWQALGGYVDQNALNPPTSRAPGKGRSRLAPSSWNRWSTEQ